MRRDILPVGGRTTVNNSNVSIFLEMLETLIKQTELHCQRKGATM